MVLSEPRRAIIFRTISPRRDHLHQGHHRGAHGGTLDDWDRSVSPFLTFSTMASAADVVSAVAGPSSSMGSACTAGPFPLGVATHTLVALAVRLLRIHNYDVPQHDPRRLPPLC